MYSIVLLMCVHINIICINYIINNTLHNNDYDDNNNNNNEDGNNCNNYNMIVCDDHQ